jgi:hypothetical protein
MQIYELGYSYYKDFNYFKGTKRYMSRRTAETDKEKLDWASNFLKLDGFESYITTLEVEE